VEEQPVEFPDNEYFSDEEIFSFIDDFTNDRFNP
jgi:hypothetical protein